MVDLLIKNGFILDGTGGPGHHADVAVRNGKIVAIARHWAGEGREVIDAAGLVVAPGFIDSHSHGDLVLEHFTHSAHKLEQGVTTEIAGMCGISAAPLSERYLLDGVRSIQGVCPNGVAEDLEGHARFSDYLDRIAATPIGTNMAFYIGHNSIRIAVMGLEDRPPTEAELEQMRQHVVNAMEAGAVGITFGLIYAPSIYADTEEVLELCRVVERYGGSFAIHMRNENVRLVQSVEEVLGIVRATGIRAVISHHKASGEEETVWGLPKKTLPMIEQANQEGFDVFLDQYPYTAAATAMASDFGKKVHTLGSEAILAGLRDSAQRAQFRAWTLGDLSAERYFDRIAISSSPSRPHLNGRFMNDVAAELGVDVCELFFDLMLEDRLRTGAIYWRMCDEDVDFIMQYPRTMIGSDGLYYPDCPNAHPRAFGSFPRVLGHYARERGVLTLPEAVHRMTGLPAMVYGLHGKGLVRVGMDADLCVFDPNTIIDNASFEHFNARCTGLHRVILAGEVVVEDAVHNGKLLGRLIRR